MTVGNLVAVTVNVLHEIDTKFNTFGMWTAVWPALAERVVKTKRGIGMKQWRAGRNFTKPEKEETDSGFMQLSYAGSSSSWFDPAAEAGWFHAGFLMCQGVRDGFKTFRMSAVWAPVGTWVTLSRCRWASEVKRVGFTVCLQHRRAFWATAPIRCVYTSDWSDVFIRIWNINLDLKNKCHRFVVHSDAFGVNSCVTNR